MNIYKKYIAYIVLHGERLNAFLLKSGTRKRYYSPRQCSKERRNTRHTKWKTRKIKSLFKGNMIVYTENSNESTKKLPEYKIIARSKDRR